MGQEITMNIKTGLGVSTIISVPFAISSIWDVNFSLVTFATYALFVVIEMIIKGSDRTVIDWLQIPFSIVKIFAKLFTHSITSSSSDSSNKVLYFFIFLSFLLLEQCERFTRWTVNLVNYGVALSSYKFQGVQLLLLWYELKALVLR